MCYSHAYPYKRFPNYLSENAIDLVKGLLVGNESQRLGGTEETHAQLRSHPFFKGINWVIIRISFTPLPSLGYHLASFLNMKRCYLTVATDLPIHTHYCLQRTQQNEHQLTTTAPSNCYVLVAIECTPDKSTFCP